uniref:Uncharacterized protein n=1 Tax=Globodera rostochiensis TaxID=31243 RepID=A0A914HC51_GLORO
MGIQATVSNNNVGVQARLRATGVGVQCVPKSNDANPKRRPSGDSESLDKVAESMQLFDEIFGEGWWNNAKADEWHKLTLEQNFHHQIDGQNTQIGQIEPNSTDQLGQIEFNSTDQLGQIGPNSTDQLGQIEPNSTDQLGQIEPNSTDQNPPLTEFDHSDNAKNAEDEQKQIDKTVAKELGFCFQTIYNWKKELGQSTPQHIYSHNEQKELMKRYYKIKDKNPKISDEEIVKRSLQFGLKPSTWLSFKRDISSRFGRA